MQHFAAYLVPLLFSPSQECNCRGTIEVRGLTSTMPPQLQMNQKFKSRSHISLVLQVCLVRHPHCSVAACLPAYPTPITSTISPEDSGASVSSIPPSPPQVSPYPTRSIRLHSCPILSYLFESAPLAPHREHVLLSAKDKIMPVNDPTQMSWSVWMTLIGFLVMIKPIREAVPLFMLQFNGLDRPEVCAFPIITRGIRRCSDHCGIRQKQKNV